MATLRSRMSIAGDTPSELTSEAERNGKPEDGADINSSSLDGKISSTPSVDKVWF